MYLENILSLVHHLLRGRPRNGNVTLDGTAGNGRDMPLLVQCVGDGKVWAFDVQPQALQQTRRRLEEVGVSAELIYDGYEELVGYVDRPLTAVVSGLGWPPGGDKTCTAQAATSIAALSAVASLLEESGLLAVVLYPGHEAGFTEAQSAREWAIALSQQQFAVLKYVFTDRQNRPPYLLAVKELR